jgi:hypothetical protein
MLGFNAHIPMIELLAFAGKIKHPSVYTTIFVPFIGRIRMIKGIRDKPTTVIWICLRNRNRHSVLELLVKGTIQRVTD